MFLFNFHADTYGFVTALSLMEQKEKHILMGFPVSSWWRSESYFLIYWVSGEDVPLPG